MRGRAHLRLIGYSDEPSALQVVVYGTTPAVGVIVVLTKAFGLQAGAGREGAWLQPRRGELRRRFHRLPLKTPGRASGM